jgi:hypothetical protein
VVATNASLVLNRTYLPLMMMAQLGQMENLGLINSPLKLSLLARDIPHQCQIDQKLPNMSLTMRPKKIT